MSDEPPSPQGPVLQDTCPWLSEAVHELVRVCSREVTQCELIDTQCLHEPGTKPGKTEMCTCGTEWSPGEFMKTKANAEHCPIPSFPELRIEVGSHGHLEWCLVRIVLDYLKGG